MTPSRFTPRNLAHSSGVVSTNRVGVPKPSVPALPALFTRMSTPAGARRSPRAPPSWSVTSKGRAPAAPPAARMASAAASARSAKKSFTSTSAPAAASMRGDGLAHALARRRSPAPACPPGRSRSSWSPPGLTPPPRRHAARRSASAVKPAAASTASVSAPRSGGSVPARVAESPPCAVEADRVGQHPRARSGQSHQAPPLGHLRILQQVGGLVDRTRHRRGGRARPPRPRPASWRTPR